MKTAKQFSRQRTRHTFLLEDPASASCNALCRLRGHGQPLSAHAKLSVPALAERPLRVSREAASVVSRSARLLRGFDRLPTGSFRQQQSHGPMGRPRHADGVTRQSCGLPDSPKPRRRRSATSDAAGWRLSGMRAQEMRRGACRRQVFFSVAAATALVLVAVSGHENKNHASGDRVTDRCQHDTAGVGVGRDPSPSEGFGPPRCPHPPRPFRPGAMAARKRPARGSQAPR